MSREWIVGLVAFVAGRLLTDAARRYALRRDLLDHPNARSSHVTPTPRGGGIAIVLVALAALVTATRLGLLSPRAGVAMIIGGTLVAAIGWLDDLRGIPAAVRASVHTIAALIALAGMGGWPLVQWGNAELSLGIFGWLLGVVAIVWFTNMYNFMDGIDGIAAVEAITGSLWLVLIASGRDPGLALVAAAIAGASAGFLTLNWSPARIFMGDVGSGLLGYLFGTMLVYAQNQRVVAAPLYCVVFGVFLVDSTVTLLRRMLHGERWYDAHRSHAYQRASMESGHRAVSLTVLLINVALSAIALSAWLRPAYTTGAVLLAIALLAAVYLVVERRRPMRA